MWVIFLFNNKSIQQTKVMKTESIYDENHYEYSTNQSEHVHNSITIWFDSICHGNPIPLKCSRWQMKTNLYLHNVKHMRASGKMIYENATLGISLKLFRSTKKNKIKWKIYWNHQTQGKFKTLYLNAFFLFFIEPLTSIIGGPDIYINSGSTINLTCIVKNSPESPFAMFWTHNNIVSIRNKRDRTNISPRNYHASLFTRILIVS